MTDKHSASGREDHRDSESLISAYFDQSLTEAEKAAFEKELAQDPFLADALEGLKQTDPQSAAVSVKALKKQLHRQLRKKLKPKHRPPVVGEYIYWAIGIILLLAVAGYLVLQMLKHR